jgi:putative membrane protein
MSVYDLPLLNAFLNTTSTVLLLIGYTFIRQKRVSLHRGFMIAALCTSVLFLIFYLIYHYNVGSVRFTGQGAIRPFYFTVLISHTILAAAVPPLAIITLSRALRSRFDKHRRIARWTLPIWLYVSVTGVLIYILLYQLYPHGA